MKARHVLLYAILAVLLTGSVFFNDRIVVVSDFDCMDGRLRIHIRVQKRGFSSWGNVAFTNFGEVPLTDNSSPSIAHYRGYFNIGCGEQVALEWAKVMVDGQFRFAHNARNMTATCPCATPTPTPWRRTLTPTAIHTPTPTRFFWTPTPISRTPTPSFQECECQQVCPCYSEYDIVSAINMNQLIQGVNEKMEEGWIPLGGFRLGSYFLHQVIVRCDQ
jgi:hypothetical protein